RELKRETQAEGSFIQRFFVETWDYVDDGTGAALLSRKELADEFPKAWAFLRSFEAELDKVDDYFQIKAPDVQTISTETLTPLFCLAKMKGDGCVSACDQEQQAAFAETRGNPAQVIPVDMGSNQASTSPRSRLGDNRQGQYC
ncbi:MAG: hypothetical protein H8M99_00395, partial [Gloeobacteraceae cyanobacterium ES-bin-144]|nr:hypothetical protein [Verrucomicrobiales bacterium]